MPFTAVAAENFAPDAVFTAVTVTPGIGPCESVTVPRTWAVVVCPNAGRATRVTATRTTAGMVRRAFSPAVRLMMPSSFDRVSC